MIYPIPKSSKQQGQEGVTLLLSVLIMSAILAISFSIATITFIEIRTSGDLTRTEPSLYGASSISEEALFNIKRNLPDPSSGYDSKVGVVTITTSTPLTNYPIVQIAIPPNSSFANTNNRYPLFDVIYPVPTDPSGPNPTGGSNYGKIKVTYLDTGNDTTDKLRVYLCQFDPRKLIDPTGTNPNAYSSPPCSDPNASAVGGYWISSPNPFLLSPTDSMEWGSLQGFDPNQQQELIFVNTTSKVIYAEVRSYAKDQSAPLGLPFFGVRALDISANNANLRRSLRVVVPSYTSGGGNGTVIIEKDTSGGDGTFSFTTTGGNGLPASLNLTTNGGVGSNSFIVTPGSGYTITESNAAGWVLAGAICTNGTVSGNTVTFSVPASGTVKCTFTNNKVASGGTVAISANNSWTVPAGVSSITIKAWGGGGGAGGGDGSTFSGGSGGGGGFTQATVNVTAGEILSIMVGGGGFSNYSEGGGGGGYSAVIRGGNTALVMAAGGGGGGGVTTSGVIAGAGGAGGGLSGWSGAGTFPGSGGSQFGGGGGFSAGSAGQGGNGQYVGGPIGGTNAGGAGGLSSRTGDGGGGGGGGGFFGGGGAYSGFGGYGGGGGSSYVIPSATNQANIGGLGRNPGQTSDPDYLSGKGFGGLGGVGIANGSPGYIVITY